jgi:hypothetical protein
MDDIRSDLTDKPSQTRVEVEVPIHRPGTRQPNRQDMDAEAGIVGRIGINGTAVFMPAPRHQQMHLKIRPRRQRIVAQAPCLSADRAMGDRKDPQGWRASHGREAPLRRESSPAGEHLQLQPHHSTLRPRIYRYRTRSADRFFGRRVSSMMPRAPTPIRPPATSAKKPNQERLTVPHGTGTVKRFHV